MTFNPDIWNTSQKKSNFFIEPLNEIYSFKSLHVFFLLSITFNTCLIWYGILRIWRENRAKLSKEYADLVHILTSLLYVDKKIQIW